VGDFLISYGNSSEVMIGDPKFLYYSQMKGNGMPGNLSNISNIDYIVYDEKFYANKAPQLKYLLDPANNSIPSNFKLIYYRYEYPKIAIYEIVKTKPLDTV
jgi:hypothetical protein